METIPSQALADSPSFKLSLQKLVDQLIVPMRSTTEKIFFQNDISSQLVVDVEEQVLASSLNYLLNAVLNRCEGAVRITAKSYNSVVLVHVESSNISTLRSGMQQLDMAQSLAEKLGGCVTINDNRKSGMLLTLSFLNAHPVAE